MDRRAALHRTLLATASWPAAPSRAEGAVLRVGPGGDVARFAEAIARARDGDRLLILPGDYRGDVAVIRQKRLDIVGVGAQPMFHGDGRHAEGKALWVVRNGDIRIENIGFRGARVPDGNGAGIRFERGRLRLQRCSFLDNEMGLLTGNDAQASLQITDCEFGQAPPGPDSLRHLLYVGHIADFSIRGSHLHHGHAGHLLKSRARRSWIAYNALVDGRGGRASYEIDLPNGGDATVLGNLIGQGALTENAAMLSFGAEGQAWPVSLLRVAHNSFVSDLDGGARFVHFWRGRLPDAARVLLLNNLFVGAGELWTGSGERAGGNLHLPLAAQDAADLEQRRLPPQPRWRGAAAALDGDDTALRPQAQFEPPLGTRAIAAPRAWSPGAFQS